MSAHGTDDLTYSSLQGAYDTFGTRAAEAARSTAQAEADARPSLIPGPVLDELVVPVASSIGVQLLQKMGWRQGKGIGTAAAAVGGGEGSKWGAVSGVGVENTPLYVLHPKVSVDRLRACWGEVPIQKVLCPHAQGCKSFYCRICQILHDCSLQVLQHTAASGPRSNVSAWLLYV